MKIVQNVKNPLNVYRVGVIFVAISVFLFYQKIVRVPMQVSFWRKCEQFSEMLSFSYINFRKISTMERLDKVISILN